MLIDGDKALIINCDSCGRLKEYEFNLFKVMKYDKIEYECSCGHINTIVVQRDSRSIFFYSNNKCYQLDLNTILRNETIINRSNDSNIFFLENKQAIREKSAEIKAKLDNIKNEAKSKKYFNNFDIIARSLVKLYSLNEENKIVCDCGNSNIRIELFFDRIELECLSCHGVKLVFAETEEDLDIILKKDKIVLKAHNISCIDSIVEKNKDIRK